MKSEELKALLETKGFEVEDYGVLYCRGPLFRLKVNPETKSYKGKIIACANREFDKWGNSEDYVAYRLPKTEQQLDWLLEGLSNLIKEGRHVDQWAPVEVDYLLRRPSKVIRKKRKVKGERPRPRLLRRTG